MKRFWLCFLLFLVGVLPASTAAASSLSLDVGYHYQDGDSGAAFSLMYSYGIYSWFEFGADFQSWMHLGEKEIDSWTETDPDVDSEGDIRKFKKLRQQSSGFFGPVFRFPLTWRKDRKYAVVPTLGLGVEMIADREWKEETIVRVNLPEEENVQNEQRQYEFGWYLRPGVTFAVSWWRIGFEHFISGDGAAQFQIMTGIDIFRITGYSG